MSTTIPARGIDASHLLAWCQGKVRHETRRAAEKAMASQKRRHKIQPRAGQYRAYRCPKCDGWHLGSG
jgi:hypothetical protein